MASEVAHPEAIVPNGDAPITNGDQTHNEDAFAENANLPKSDTALDVNVAADPNPGGPTPVEDVAPGITPVASFIPKEAPVSHPTPPPDEPLNTSEANVETVTAATEDAPMEDVSSKMEAEPAEPTASTAQPTLPSSESSLVRPREDDDDDGEGERAAKRSKVDSDIEHVATTADTDPADVAPVDVTPAEQTAASAHESAPSQTHDQVVETQLPVAAPESAIVKDEASIPEKPVESGAKSADMDVKMAEPDAKPVGKPAGAQPESSAQPATQSAAALPKPAYSEKPLTQTQTKFLAEKMKNMKKTKHAAAFLAPVDPVALNIPHYTNVISNPMDLGTMEAKLKSSKYASVQAFVDDFNLIISNTRTFNGDNHAVTQAGLSMEAYFKKMLETVPSADQPVVQKAHAKKASPKPHGQTARRESRSATVPAPQPASAAVGNNSSSEAFALQADGTPQIRRESTTNRPARAIKPPPARELSYAKPKRKEHQLELKFCEHVLDEVKNPKHAKQNYLFLHPVDPVALNIPHYRQIVKQPMDLSTMTQKLKQGQYGKAAEFKKDFELMIANCLAFNPPGNVVRDLGIEFQRIFEALWKQKDRWEQARKNEGPRGNSASADEDSEEEDEDDEQGTDVNDPNAAAKTIADLQKQLADMQSSLAALGQGQPPAAKNNKKAKTTAKASGRKAGGGAAATKSKAPAPKAKAPPKKVKQVTYEEKQEISEAVGNMNEEQVAKLTKIITENCSKYADQEEMELEIDDLPNDVQAMLLKYVRSIFGNPNRGRAASPDDGAALDDDDFEPGGRSGYGTGAANKRKKHKPMGKEEQQERINTLQKQLSQFAGGAGGAGASQGGSQAGGDSSGDDSEESEEE
ncbi:Bromodomain-containing factor 1 [Lecanosticta acicola]|uniref:Bromodomain-containing factor 1 n=1 Tax=Lecanosticta acicola TaxID=111012 RepID=A0AAI8Z6C9_9PEZI|nr:Bromodomain-containing factor 1 [Lecanosticta acicola]